MSDDFRGVQINRDCAINLSNRSRSLSHFVNSRSPPVTLHTVMLRCMYDCIAAYCRPTMLYVRYLGSGWVIPSR